MFKCYKHVLFMKKKLNYFQGGGGDDDPPPNHPPYIRTPGVLKQSSPIFAKSGETSAEVSWTEPAIYDNDEGRFLPITVSPNNVRSGGRFSEGGHTIFFSATDSGGLAVQTSLYFEVKVIRCGYAPTLSNGYLSCGSGGTLGSVCTVLCEQGYLSSQSASLVCSETGSWSGGQPRCDPVKCGPTPRVKHGEVRCTTGNSVYGSYCQLVCLPGYSASGISLVSCNSNGQWSEPSTCVDTQPPHFINGECPTNIQVPIDSPNNTAAVFWDVPKGTDNSNENVTIMEMHGYRPGQRLNVGVTRVTYTINDSSNNVGGNCSFLVQVQSISCKPPYITTRGQENLRYDCPNLYTYGAQCTLSCIGGYPLEGATQIRCLKDRNDNIDWLWNKDDMKPFCKETNCTQLREPRNGAMSCSAWTYGQMCIMQCQKGYDVPASTYGEFVCGKSDGNWRPNDHVPDCSATVYPHNMHLPSDFYYYTDKCNSSAENLLEIQENFVMALSASRFLEYCRNNPDCQAKYVRVSCGPTSSRRKRDIHRNPRPERFAYIVEFEIILPLNIVDDETKQEAIARTEEKLSGVSRNIRRAAMDGLFDIPGLRVENDSVEVGLPIIQCPNGMVPRPTENTCVGCPVGQFMSNITDRCEVCPIGGYQNMPNSVVCKTCPLASNTTSNASTGITQCRAYCPPGEYSPTGLSPCAKCPSDSYQDSAMSRGCQSCPSGTRTPAEGATSKSSCIAYDVQISSALTVETNATASELTLTTWLLLRINQSQHFSVITSSGAHSLVLTFAPTLSLRILGLPICQTGIAVKAMKWTYLALVIDHNNVAVFINGNEVCRNATNLPTRNNIVTSTDSFHFAGDVQLSNTKIALRSSTREEIKQWSTTCASYATAEYNIDALVKTTGARVIIPSMCDAIDECMSNPCGPYDCVNTIGDFHCRCSNGYTGRQCQFPPNFCTANECENGARCINGVSNYTCACTYGFQGQLCEKKAVDGNWSSWADWSACSSTCGGGFKRRSRSCDNPPPDPEGTMCPGESVTTEVCNNKTCPECIQLRRSPGVIVNCNDTVDILRCTISCTQGLYFAMPHLPVYECGLATGYVWNHQSEKNPTATLPSCSEVEPPSNTDLGFVAHYDLTCSDKNVQALRNQVDVKIRELGCVRENTCTINVKSEECNTSTPHGVTIKIEMKPNSEDGIHQYNKTSDSVNTYVEHIIDLDKAAQHIANQSHDFFQVTLDEKQYNVNPGASGLGVVSSMNCPTGSVRLDMFCAQCPVGTYSDGGAIILCPVGYYQDETGQTECKKCPAGHTTFGIGSLKLADCINDYNVHAGNKETSEKESTKFVVHVYSEGSSDTTAIALGVSGAVLLLILSSIVCLFMYRRKANGTPTLGEVSCQLICRFRNGRSSKPI
ncbi:sushi, von Willebrand factor type A, EGF and pentraxin domain-containing protein 1-like isoform X2 [Dreissena polymorpha]|uniref:sushi, von Willebrand factor type A, EGF and pentraxin domain-containing protein 1-like isoform X2 n=1 Tax=Dreissena polymorpha TaxID=45954 RepID=UPI0022641155|nr:sushi, von Willebrand factor type A, EGF and pentraxin domain-containing protein 1-like isoform X2 [Dreissena polymorpha]